MACVQQVAQFGMGLKAYHPHQDQGMMTQLHLGMQDKQMKHPLQVEQLRDMLGTPHHRVGQDMTSLTDSGHSQNLQTQRT